jgi:OmpA-OmpF porin, OOP family
VNASAKVTAWELVGVGSWPLANQFSIYGKLGFYRAKSEVSASAAVAGFGASTSGSDTNTDLTFGAGGLYDITKTIGIRAEWQRYSKTGGSNTGGKNDVDVLGVGVLFRF